MAAVKVLHVYRTYYPDPPGGLQEAIRQIGLATQNYGVENTVFALSPAPRPQEIERPEGRVLRARSWWAPASCDLGGPEAVQMFAELSRQVDVVQYHFPWPFADVLHALVRPTARTVMTYHSDIVRQKWLGRIYGPLMQRTLDSMSAVIATSSTYARTSPVLSQDNLRDKVRVIPLGIVESSYDATGDEAVFQRLGLQGQESYFLFIGVLRYYKGIHTLLQAARRVGARIVIAGSGPQGESLKAMNEQLGNSNVIFAGQVSDAEKVTLIKQCRALVLPSHVRSEAFGMVLVEASMFGRPMVSCEIGSGTSYVNLHEETGLIVPPEEPLALADALNTLLADARLAYGYGAAARVRYETHFSGPALGRAYADLYNSL